MSKIVEVKRENLKEGNIYLDTNMDFKRIELKFEGFDDLGLPYFSSDEDYYEKDTSGLILYLMPVYEEVENES